MNGKKTLEFEYLKFLLCGDDQNHFNLSAAVGQMVGFPKMLRSWFLEPVGVNFSDRTQPCAHSFL